MTRIHIKNLWIMCRRQFKQYYVSRFTSSCLLCRTNIACLVILKMLTQEPSGWYINGAASQVLNISTSNYSVSHRLVAHFCHLPWVTECVIQTGWYSAAPSHLLCVCVGVCVCIVHVCMYVCMYVCIVT